MKTVGKILKNSILIISTLIIMLFLLLYLIFQVPAVQHFVIQKAQQKTKEAANISFTLDHFTYLPPNKLKLSTIMVEGSDSDTLLYSKELTVKLQLRALLSKKISIESVNIDSTTIKLKRITETGKFNFHFSEDPAPADTASTTPSAWEF
ncbi:MAG: AsmA family protein, partial [Bacteroidales bacterium]